MQQCDVRKRVFAMPLTSPASCAGARRGASGARVLSATHIIADLTQDLGGVVHDYLNSQ